MADTRQPACPDCGETFWLNESQAGFFIARRLHLPRRCPACRKARRGRQVELVGKLVFLAPRFGFIETEDGGSYFMLPESAVEDDLNPGDTVHFLTDPARPVLDGCRPCASKVWRAGR